jgi:antitoxin ParD1/3/4
MTISISPELQTLVQQEFATGNYSSPDEVLLAAVRLLRDRNRRLEELRSEIRPALERLDRGDGEPLDMEAIKAEARRQFEQSKS